jgi:radical SAM-linked protein
MRPKPLLSLALPLAVGVEGLHELCEFELAEEAGPSFVDRLAASLPAHMQLHTLEPYEASRSLPARVVGASYRVQVSASSDPLNGGDLGVILADAVRRFADAPQAPIEKERDGRVRRVDVKAYVDRVSVETGTGAVRTLSFRTAVTPAGTARPERVVEALSNLVGVRLEIKSISRTRIHLV